jgi:hypothetical protein
MLVIPSIIIHGNPGVETPQLTEALLEHIEVEDDDGECFPSHTSHWSQPYDAAQNSFYKAVFI